MSKLLEEFMKLLKEAKVIRVDDPTNIYGKSTILQNPSITEYEAFKNNTKYKAIRGIGIDDDIYITDAYNGIHVALEINVLQEKGYDIEKIDPSDYVNCTFSEDEHDNFSYLQSSKNKAFEKLLKTRKSSKQKNNGYFNYEDEYKDYEIKNVGKPEFLSFEQWLKIKKGK